MKRIFALLMLSVLFVASLSAATVPEEIARRAATNFWNTYRPQDQKAVSQLQSLSFPELHNMYVFANGNQGFVLVAADDRVQPILGYSFDSPFAAREINPELRFWLLGYEEQIASALASDRAANPRWNELLENPVPPEPLTLTNVPMLMTTAWDQDAPYNDLCPYDEVYQEKAVVGCVATAMAQIMKYWNHPARGTGSRTYMHHNDELNHSYGVLSADFENTTYLWEQMPDRATYASSSLERTAVSTLSYHCGVAVDMMYGPSSTGGSGAYTTCGGGISACAVSAFHRYFKYEPSLVYRMRSSYSDSAWLSMIDSDLALGRPLYYNGRDDEGGHAFVLDGSDLDTHYHFNWGWSGYGNGFYAMNNLAPGSGGAGGNATYTFNQYQGAIFGLVPIPEAYDTVEVWDTICSNSGRYSFYEYTLPNASCDTLLRHLDTVFNLHLRRVSTYMLTFRPNFGTGNEFDMNYCYLDTVVMPECPFVKDGYRFRGWCQNKRGTETIYQAGDSVRLRGHLVFYAIWQDTTVGIAEVEEQELLIWPNPTEDKINFSITDAEDVTVNVIDAWGRVAIQRKVVGGKAKISLERLPAGTYTVVVYTADAVYKKQIIKN